MQNHLILNGAERPPEAFAERAATAGTCGDQRVWGAPRQADANASRIVLRVPNGGRQNYALLAQFIPSSK
jgi:hypothetical protein